MTPEQTSWQPPGQSKLVTLTLFNTCIKEDGAKTFAEAIIEAPSLRKLNLQYNALKGESKKALELANAARPAPLFLVM